MPPPPFVSAHSRAQWVILLLAANIVLDLASVAAVALKLRQTPKGVAGAWSSVLSRRQDVVDTLAWLVVVATAVLFLMWLYRAHKNLAALGATGLKFSPGWAVGWFLVPVMNLVRPPQVVKEIWDASQAEGAARTAPRQPEPTSVIQAWWAVYVASNLLANRSWGEWADLLARCGTIVAGGLAIRIVTAIDAMQAARRRQISLAGVLAVQPVVPRFDWEGMRVRGGALAAGLVLLGAAISYAIHPGPSGVALTVTTAPTSTPGAEFDLLVAVANQREGRAVAVGDIDLAEEYLHGFSVVRIEPEPASRTGGSFTFDVSIPPGETRVFRFRLRARRAGTFRGDVDMWEGWRYLTAVAETTVRQR